MIRAVVLIHLGVTSSVPHLPHLRVPHLRQPNSTTKLQSRLTTKLEQNFAPGFPESGRRVARLQLLIWARFEAY